MVGAEEVHHGTGLDEADAAPRIVESSGGAGNRLIYRDMMEIGTVGEKTPYVSRFLRLIQSKSRRGDTLRFCFLVEKQRGMKGSTLGVGQI